MNSLPDHLNADIAQKKESNPGNRLLKSLEILNKHVHCKPAQHGHKKLKEGKCPRNLSHTAPAHVRAGQTIGHGDRKGIHSQAYTQSRALNDKQKSHIFSHKSLSKAYGSAQDLSVINQTIH